MRRFNLLPRLAAVALATVLAVAVGATALSQQGPSFVDVTVDGAMAGDAIAVSGDDFGTADASGSATVTMKQDQADKLVGMGNPFTVNGDAVDGTWDGYTYTIAGDTGDDEEPAEEPVPGAETVANRPRVTVGLRFSFPHDSDATIPSGSSTKLVVSLAPSSSLDALAKAKSITNLRYSLSGVNNDGLGNLTVSDGLLLQIGTDTDESAAPTLSGDVGAGNVISHEGLHVVVPAGTPEDTVALLTGSISVGSVMVSYTDASGEQQDFVQDDTRATGRGNLTVATVAPDVAAIAFGRSIENRVTGALYPDLVAVNAFAAAANNTDDTTTQFTLNIHNANGAPSQISSISSIVVSTDNGVVHYNGNAHPSIAQGPDTDCSGMSATCELEPAARSPWPLKAYHPLRAEDLTFTVDPDTIGSATVTVQVISRAGLVLAEQQLVTVHGLATELDVDLATGPLGGNMHHLATDDGRSTLRFNVSAYDNHANHDGERVRLVVPTGLVLAKSPTNNFQNKLEDRVDMEEVGRSRTQKTAYVDLSAISPAVPLPGGEQTAVITTHGHPDVMAGVIPAISGEANFVVAGPAADITADADPIEATERGQIISVTVTAQDANGNAVANGTGVTVTSSDLDGDGDTVLRGVSAHTKDSLGGEVSRDFVVIGPGAAVVIGDVGDAVGDPSRTVVISTAGAPAAPDCSEVGIAGLSATSGFATWSHDCDTSASALFTGLSARGSTAIHLWNGTAWVRYSVVDGSEVPGSSNFSVMGGDILYISN